MNCDPHVFEQIPGANLARCRRCPKVIYRENKFMNKKFLLKKIVLCAVVLSFCFSQLACNKWKAAVDSTARLGTLVKNLGIQNEKSLDENLYGEETALRVAKQLRDKAAPLVRNYISAVEKLSREYKNRKDIPVSRFQELRAQFDAMEKEVLDVLEIFKLLTPEQKVLIETVIEAIRTALSTIADGFSSADSFITGGEFVWQV